MQNKEKCGHYGTLPDGREVMLYHLSNKSGISAEITDLGGVIRSLKVPGRGGKISDIVMGHEDLNGQLTKRGWNCGIVGRCANRINYGRLVINSRCYNLEKNLGDMTLHSGSGNYANKLFSGELFSDSEGEKLRLYYRDRGEGGFPGEVDVWVTYVLTPDNKLKIRYRALPEKDTVLNMTSHCYFNLSGHDSGSISEQYMQIDADFYLPAYKSGLPTGEVLSVAGTVFDLNEEKKLREGLESDEAQIRLLGGYDHNFCLRGTGYRRAARAYDEKSGREMTLYTDMPGLQLYTAGNETPDNGFKDGASYAKYGAFCLETQYYPDAVSHSHFPSPIFPSNRVFESETCFEFSIR